MCSTERYTNNGHCLVCEWIGILFCDCYCHLHRSVIVWHGSHLSQFCTNILFSFIGILSLSTHNCWHPIWLCFNGTTTNRLRGPMRYTLLQALLTQSWDLGHHTLSRHLIMPWWLGWSLLNISLWRECGWQNEIPTWVVRVALKNSALSFDILVLVYNFTYNFTIAVFVFLSGHPEGCNYLTGFIWSIGMHQFPHYPVDVYVVS